MGRTTQTMTQLVAQEEAYWAPFRRALRKEDQEIFDRLFAAARHHSAPAHYASHATPFDSMLLAMLLEAMKVVEVLRRRLDLLEQGAAGSMPPAPEASGGGRRAIRREGPPALLPGGGAGGA
jgi:hypothetical protein